MTDYIVKDGKFGPGTHLTLRQMPKQRRSFCNEVRDIVSLVVVGAFIIVAAAFAGEFANWQMHQIETETITQWSIRQ